MGNVEDHVQSYTVRCAYRFLDGQTGITTDAQSVRADTLDGATRAAQDFASDRVGLALVSAVLTMDATGQIVWSLQAPMSAEAVAAFGAALPPGAGT